MSKQKKFKLTEKEVIKIGNSEARIYNIVSTTKEDASKLLTDRVKAFGYIKNELIWPILILNLDKDNNDFYVSLVTTNEDWPVIICNNFIYNEFTVVADLENVLEKWYDYNNIIKSVKKLTNSTNYILSEDENEITITIKK